MRECSGLAQAGRAACHSPPEERGSTSSRGLPVFLRPRAPPPHAPPPDFGRTSRRSCSSQSTNAKNDKTWVAHLWQGMERVVVMAGAVSRVECTLRLRKVVQGELGSSSLCQLGVSERRWTSMGMTWLSCCPDRLTESPLWRRQRKRTSSIAKQSCVSFWKGHISAPLLVAHDGAPHVPYTTFGDRRRSPSPSPMETPSL